MPEDAGAVRIGFDAMVAWMSTPTLANSKIAGSKAPRMEPGRNIGNFSVRLFAPSVYLIFCSMGIRLTDFALAVASGKAEGLRPVLRD